MKIDGVSVDKTENRNKKVDLLRGIAMCLVLWHHVGGPLSDMILAFHMALFFIISGYLSTKSKRINRCSMFEYMWSDATKLLIPYFVFELIVFILSILLIPHRVDIPVALKSILLCYNMPGYSGVAARLWFFWCLFWCNLLMWLFNKCIRNKLNLFGGGIQRFQLLCYAL